MTKDARRRWREGDLRAAVASASTLAALLRALGLKSGSRQYLHSVIARLGIDTSHFKSKPRKLLASDDDLRRTASVSRSMTEVLDALGVPHRTHNFYKLKRRFRELEIDTQVIRKLGLIAAGGNYDQVQRRVIELGLETLHFTGMGWNKGLRFRPSAPLEIEKVLVAGRWASTHHLKTRLFREGLKVQACELCGWAQQVPDGRIPVGLDHINGDRTDNRLENLRILCPNCHSLQPTHRGLNQKRAKLRRT